MSASFPLACALGLNAWSLGALSLGALSLGATGCATTSAPQDNFPAPEEIAELTQTPAPKPEGKPVFAPEKYQLVGPVPEKIGDLPANTGDPVTLAMMKKLPDGAFATAGMQCAAREMAYATIKGGAAPGELLRRHIYGACGNPEFIGSVGYYGGEVRDTDTPDTLLVEWRAQLEQFAQSAGPGFAVGAALVVEQGQGMLVFTAAPRHVKLDPLDPVAKDGFVTVRGEVLFPAESVIAMANQGLYGYARCEVDPQVRVPKFVARCPVDPNDAHAWISVSALPPKRFIANSVAGVMVRPAGGSPLAFEVHRYSDSGVRKPGAEAFAEDFVTRLNAIRKQAGAGPMKNASKQSATAARLSGHLYRARRDRDEELSERIMMGLLAGWDVDEPIVTGGVVYFSLNFEQAGGKQDMAEVLGAAMQWPGSRSAILDPEYDLIAVGPQPVGDQELMVFIGSWDRFDGHSIAVDSQDAMKGLRAARRNGLTVPGVMPEVDAKTQEVAQLIEDGELTAEAAMEDLLETAVQKYQHSMRAWTIYPRSLDDIAWPEELLENDTVYLSLAVAIEQHPSLAWSRQVILVVAHIPNSGQTYAEGSTPVGKPVPSRIASDSGAFSR